MATQDELLLTLFVVRLAFPVALLATSLSLLTQKRAHAPGSHSPITSVVVAVTTPRRSLILSILSLVALTYFLDGFALVLHSVLSKTWHGTPSHEWWKSQWSGLDVEAVVGLLASGLLAIVGVWKESQGLAIWTMKRPKFWAVLAVVGTTIEVALIALSVNIYTKPSPEIPELPRSTKFLALLHSLFPLFRLLVLIPLYPVLALPRMNYVPVSEVHQTDNGVISVASAEETSLLVPVGETSLASRGLNASAANGQLAYGTFRPTRSFAPTTGTTTRSHTPAPSEAQDVLTSLKASALTAKAQGDVAKTETPALGDLYRRIKRLAPYLWPKNNVWLQFLAFVCVLVLLVGRAVNVAVPLVFGTIVDIFEKQFGSDVPVPQARSFWPYLLAYVGLRFLQGSGGLGALRDTLWAPVMQYSDREMSEMTFNHLLSLSLSFHMRRKTGEILRILDRGAAINRVVELLLFNLCPIFIDIFVALGIFVWYFDWELAVLVAFVMFAYVAASVLLTSWRSRIRRQMNDKDIITRGIHTDCLLNYETVKYFGGEVFEGERYANAIKDYQSLEYRVIVSLNLLNLVQNLLMAIGFLVGGIIVAFRVTSKISSPSEFVIFIIYLGQLYGPLNQLGYMYRSINTSLIDTERLMKLLDEPTEVNDEPGAPDLIVNDGEIEFDNVFFSYDGRTTALNGVSFKVPKGSSVALVGESGSGKSTVLRLLYRFYDLKEGEGRILIDGQDVRDVTQLSLRKAIGVVPQDSVLFNASIAYNIGYGKLGASLEEIEAAAKAAQMHDRITSFPDGYDTKVGERGVRLSGGEKQRVAIARTLLKNPPILLLDEATSALDTSTEKDIQNALQNLVKGRSSLSIAHRLSTIASADVILVLKDGQIVEQGSHRELLENDGVFASMWADQIRAEEPQFSSFNKQEVSGYAVEPAKAADAEVPKTGTTESEPEPVPEPANHEEDISVQAAPRSEEQETAVHAETESKEGTTEPSFAAIAAQESAADAPVVEYASAPSTSSDAPVAFPSSGPVAFPSEVVSFPSYDESPEPEREPGSTTPSAPVPTGVTFDESVQFPASRSGTPDPSADPVKRKRTASQNFQRFARRVSLVGRRQGSIPPLPGQPLKDELKDGSGNDEGNVRGEGSARGEGESPAASLNEGKKALKDRREKLKKRFSIGK
ncbi:hypothetical protein EW145_g5852 [Phellinidium pouzarii]|uniref:ABC transporter domain-containing protein n=1 Tax=Phellinidium pouzarii TaxID=167371 RepID=A0A4S4KYJ5_9AGAM|nr:hypothetical protein EW145_g5852 [Phellinidium pouzarii]